MKFVLFATVMFNHDITGCIDERTINKNVMKRNKLLSIIMGLAATLSFNSCSDDFLNVLPEDTVLTENYYTTDAAMQMGTAALYTKPWFDAELNTGMWVGDARAGVASNTDQAGLRHLWLNTNVGVGSDIEGPWRSFYAISSMASNILEKIDLYSTPEVSEGAKNFAKGECHFMRSVAYFYLVCIYNDVPVITGVKTELDKQHRRNTRETVWDFLVSEMEKAANLLPESAPKGRINKWSAKAYLSRYYLYLSALKSVGGVRDQVFLDKAKLSAQAVMDSSAFGLEANYEDLFKLAFENGKESIFATQWKYNAGWGLQNTYQAYYAYSPDITGTGDGWGVGHGATFYILEKFFKLGETTRLRGTYFVNGQEYDYMHQLVVVGGKKVPKAPLIYTDDKKANIKKYIIGMGVDNNGEIASMNNGMNTYKMRYAEVLLNYAEAVLGNAASTSDASALKAVNAVRARAGFKNDSLRTEITAKELYSEREMEFTLEQIMWYEVIKRFYYQPDVVLAEISAQNRSNKFKVTTRDKYTIQYGIDPENPSDLPKTIVSETGSPATAEKMFLPLPDYEAGMDPTLLLEPVPYVPVQ